MIVPGMSQFACREKPFSCSMSEAPSGEATSWRAGNGGRLKREATGVGDSVAAVEVASIMAPTNNIDMDSQGVGAVVPAGRGHQRANGLSITPSLSTFP